MRRVWSLPILLIGVAITLLVVGNVALAAGNASGDSKKDDFLSRVADALGLPFDDVKSAHDEAKRELEDDQLFEAILKLVEEGLLTQSEADELSGWLLARPDSANERTMPLLAAPAVRFELSKYGFGKPHHGLSDSIIAGMADALDLTVEELESAIETANTSDLGETRLENILANIQKLEDSGKLTESEASELTGWFTNVPEWLLADDLASTIIGRLFKSRSFEMFKGFSDGSLPFAFPHGDYDLEQHFDGDERFRFKIFPRHGELEGLDEFFDKFHTPDGGEYVPHSLEGFEELIPRLEELFENFPNLGEHAELELDEVPQA